MRLLRALPRAGVQVCDRDDPGSFQAHEIPHDVRAPVTVADDTKIHDNLPFLQVMRKWLRGPASREGKPAGRAHLSSCKTGRDNFRDRQTQYAPEPLITAAGVISRIFRSSQSDHEVAYLKSSRTISSNFTVLRLVTCHKPVMPGFASRILRRCHV